MLAAEYTAVINAERLEYMKQRDEAILALRKVQECLRAADYAEALHWCNGTLEQLDNPELWPPLTKDATE